MQIMAVLFLLCFVHIIAINTHEFWFDEMLFSENGDNMEWTYYDPNNFGFKNPNNIYCDQYNPRNTRIECLQIRGDGILTRSSLTNTSGYYDITLSCLIVAHPEYGLEINDIFIIEFCTDNNTEKWYTLAHFDGFNITNNGVNNNEFTHIILPNIADDNIGVSIRFRIEGSASKFDRIMIDSVSLTGTSIKNIEPSIEPTLEPTALPTRDNIIIPSHIEIDTIDDTTDIVIFDHTNSKTLISTIIVSSVILLLLIGVIIYQRIKHNLNALRLKLQQQEHTPSEKNNNEQKIDIQNQIEGEKATIEGDPQEMHNTIHSKSSISNEIEIDNMTPNERQFKYEINSISQVSFYVIPTE